ncbi:post-transcriptional regulator [Paenibacillus sp. FSL H8-0537]|uniref:post-transcriptional regulator n=1 Tax=Paenibacillus sp. FSL H8-0537 TaxID=2921399 RepID=UPI0031017844
MEEQDLAQVIEQLCNSKAEEFRLIGYEHANGKDIWACVSAGYKKSGQPELHKLVNDILSLKVTSFMNFLTISAYRGTHF